MEFAIYVRAHDVPTPVCVNRLILVHPHFFDATSVEEGAGTRCTSRQRCVRGQARDFMCQFVHPNLVGHTYIADLVIGWLQNRAVSMLLEEWLSPGAHAHDSGDVAGMQVCTQSALLRCLVPALCG